MGIAIQLDTHSGTCKILQVGQAGAHDMGKARQNSDDIVQCGIAILISPEEPIAQGAVQNSEPANVRELLNHPEKLNMRFQIGMSMAVQNQIGKTWPAQGKLAAWLGWVVANMQRIGISRSREGIDIVTVPTSPLLQNDFCYGRIDGSNGRDAKAADQLLKIGKCSDIPLIAVVAGLAPIRLGTNLKHTQVVKRRSERGIEIWVGNDILDCCLQREESSLFREACDQFQLSQTFPSHQQNDCLPCVWSRLS